MTAAFEAWHNHFGDLPLFSTKPDEKPPRREERPRASIRENHAYPVLIRSAKMTKAQMSGDVQLAIEFEINELSKHLVWLTLPIQESDIVKDPDLVKHITQRRMEDIQRIYAAACPYDFATYDERKQGEDGPVYFDFQGEPMKDRQFVERKAYLQEALVAKVKEMHDMVGKDIKDIIGAQLYIVVVPNKRNPKYPYTNIYAQPPRKYPLHNPEQARTNYEEAPF